jgi:hypothetical protein
MRINPKPTAKQIKRRMDRAVRSPLPPEPGTYLERTAPDHVAAQRQNIESFVADVKAGKACFSEALEFRKQMNARGIKGINLIYRAGLAWQRASDKNQYDFYFYDFADTLLRPEDRPHVTREIVKVALHLANVLSAPVTTVEQAAPLVQKCFIALGFEVAGRRQLETAHPPRNIFSELVSEAKTARAVLCELKTGKPITDWNTDELDTFLREWKPVVDDYEQVKRLRLGT